MDVHVPTVSLTDSLILLTHTNLRQFYISIFLDGFSIVSLWLPHLLLYIFTMETSLNTFLLISAWWYEITNMEKWIENVRLSDIVENLYLSWLAKFVINFDEPCLFFHQRSFIGPPYDNKVVAVTRLFFYILLAETLALRIDQPHVDIEVRLALFWREQKSFYLARYSRWWQNGNCVVR